MLFSIKSVISQEQKKLFHLHLSPWDGAKLNHNEGKVEKRRRYSQTPKLIHSKMWRSTRVPIKRRKQITFVPAAHIYPPDGIICSMISRSLPPAAPDFMGSENEDPRELRLGKDLPKLKLWMRSKGDRIFLKVKFHNFTWPQSPCHSYFSLLTAPLPFFANSLSHEEVAAPHLSGKSPKR